ncbi:hypothetical protein DKS73_22280 [Salmonella enterica subsp. enterica serovar Virchow]|uniref:Uncharacterized protein n=4 Tax=Salmonella enterica TaxID=28901 RepID=A0A5T3RJ11_SALER|nr:hypothetical protein [Salmonella enterica subsp. enterica serovar Heidelberg]EAA3462962.1 hypothetical protein [Salmonella enterica subsp. enterica serovar Miami]EAA4490753.1 hypothetical protein [Salmonella enterica subsp. enterica]EAA6277958.1 hypothetical protein [Salmonella enterica subsp. enterica serovar Telhashomer]EAM9795014.1 hypothetical protein [Salmonella enterica]EBQ5851731.1 hypothetical protein [Salmonella enterica subsp. enterica serovar Virchow]EBS4938027.1 hypothetical pr
MKATVALTNKLTRIVWRLLTESTSFNIIRTFAMNYALLYVRNPIPPEFAGSDEKTVSPIKIQGPIH